MKCTQRKAPSCTCSASPPRTGRASAPPSSSKAARCTAPGATTRRASRCKPQVQWLENRCIGCQTCLKACPHGACTWIRAGQLVRDRHAVQVLRRRARKPARPMPMELPGPAGRSRRTAAASCSKTGLLRKIRRRGDPLGRRADPAGRLCAGAGCSSLQRRAFPPPWIPAGCASRAALERLLPYVDLILFDLKLIDPVEHERWTGVETRDP